MDGTSRLLKTLRNENRKQEEENIAAMTVEAACVHDVVMNDTMNCEFNPKLSFTNSNSFIFVTQDGLKYKVEVTAVED